MDATGSAPTFVAIVDFIVYRTGNVQLVPRCICMAANVSSIFVVREGDEVLNGRGFFCAKQVRVFRPIIRKGTFARACFTVGGTRVEDRTEVGAFVIDITAGAVLVRVICDGDCVAIFRSLEREGIMVLRRDHARCLLYPVNIAQFCFSSILIRVVFLRLNFFPVSVRCAIQVDSMDIFVNLPVGVSPLMDVRRVGAANGDLNDR